MNINYYNPYVREELMLYHHGVLGQKWGKQNGPPYPLAAGAHSASEKKAGWRKSLSGKISDHRRRKADRDAANDVAVQTGTNALNFSKHVTKQNSGYGTMRRYGEGLIKPRVSKEYADQYNKSRKKYLDAVSKIELKDRRPLDEAKKKNPDFVVKGEKDEASKKHQEQISKVTKAIEDHDILGESRIHELDASKNPEDKKRIRDAADLGIKALDKMGRDSADDINHITDDDREWFVYEDQTIGLTTIADMVNRGKSKEQIRNAIKAANDIDYDYDEDTNISENHRSAIFELQEVADEESYNSRTHRKSFVDACFEVKAEQNKTSNTNKNASLAKSMRRSGKSYAEIAKSLGITESNVQYLLSK